MSFTEIVCRRGTTARRLMVIPKLGEPIYDINRKELFIGDNITLGGISVSNSPFDPTFRSIMESSDFAALSYDMIAVDTTHNSIRCVLPIDPAVGAIVRLFDYASTFGTHNLVIDGNGKLVNYSDNDLLLSSKGGYVAVFTKYQTNGSWVVINAESSRWWNHFIKDLNPISIDSDYVLEDRDWALVDSTAGNHNFILPLNPKLGTFIRITDSKKEFDEHPVKVSTTDKLIDGVLSKTYSSEGLTINFNFGVGFDGIAEWVTSYGLEQVLDGGLTSIDLDAYIQSLDLSSIPSWIPSFGHSANLLDLYVNPSWISSFDTSMGNVNLYQNPTWQSSFDMSIAAIDLSNNPTWQTSFDTSLAVTNLYMNPTWQTSFDTSLSETDLYANPSWNSAFAISIASVDLSNNAKWQTLFASSFNALWNTKTTDNLYQGLSNLYENGLGGSSTVTTDFAYVILDQLNANTILSPKTIYIVDTVTSAFTLVLPLNPIHGDIIGIRDKSSTFGIHNLTIDNNNHLLAGVNNSFICDISQGEMNLIYTDAINGWFIDTIGVGGQITVNTGSGTDLSLVNLLTLPSWQSSFDTSISALDLHSLSNWNTSFNTSINAVNLINLTNWNTSFSTSLLNAGVLSSSGITSIDLSSIPSWQTSFSTSINAINLHTLPTWQSSFDTSAAALNLYSLVSWQPSFNTSMSAVNLHNLTSWTTSFNTSINAIDLSLIPSWQTAFASSASSINNSAIYIELNSAITVVKNTNYLTDTRTTAFSVILPLNPVLGDTIEFVDATSSFDIHNLTILRNGHNIMGVADDLIADVKNSTVRLTYYNTTYGWRLS